MLPIRNSDEIVMDYMRKHLELDSDRINYATTQNWIKK